MRFIGLLMVFAVTACQSMASAKHPLKNVKDGAPLGHAPTRFQKVKPKQQPLSRYGNPASYAVEGRKYQVLRTASGYKSKGIASWYGSKFHKKRTSSGDHYDMYAMTAAHKTLPIPSYVKVKNLRNGRETIVKINDRGPFRSDRIIDLSYAAATKLGLLPAGTAPVEVEAIIPGGAKSKRVARYYLQAGAFSTRQAAVAAKGRVKQLTSTGVSIERYQKHFIVKIGPFNDKRSTDILQAKLKLKGVKGAFAILQ